MFALANEQAEAFKSGGGVFGCFIHWQQDPDDSSTKLMQIPSRRILQLLKERYKVRDRAEDIKTALMHTESRCVCHPCRGEDGCPNSWLEAHRNLYRAATLGGALPKYDFDQFIDISSSFHTLKPITDVVFVRQIKPFIKVIRRGKDLRQ